MIADRPFKTRLTVRFVKRSDGGLRAFCEHVPGFYLSSANRQAVVRDVVPALETLVKANFGVDATVSPLGYGMYHVTENIDEPFEVPSNVSEFPQDYLVESRIAA